MPQNIEIARQEGEQFRSVRLARRDDGSLRIDAQDMGPLVERVWGDSDYEFWVTVPKDAVPDLAFALLKEKYEGRLNAVDELREFCSRHALAHEFGSWV